MKKVFCHQTSSAQVMIEYLVITILIAFLIFSALNFKQSGSIGNTTWSQAQSYYQSGYRIINQPDSQKKIDGGWCEWSDCVDGYKERSCACPRPALGGVNCSGDSFQACS